MLKNILYITIFSLISQLAYADEAADKAKFKELYAQFKDLYANSEAIDPIIVVAEKLYKLVPKVYGKNSKTHGVITYSLASLYDEKGGKTNSRDEKRALKYYVEYFELQNALKVPNNKVFLLQYQNYVQSYYNVNKSKSNNTISNKFLKIANNIELSNIEKANVEFMVAFNRITNGKINGSKALFNSVYNRYIQEYGENHKQVGYILYWLAQIDIKNRNSDQAITKLNRLIDIYTSFDNDDERELVKNVRLRLYEIYFSLKNDEKTSDQIQHLIILHENGNKPIYEKDDPNEYSPIIRVAPKYPVRAMENRIDGFVIFSLTVAADGTTKDIKAILSSAKMFEKSAISAAQKSKYRPRIIDGLPVDAKNIINSTIFRLGH